MDLLRLLLVPGPIVFETVDERRQLVFTKDRLNSRVGLLIPSSKLVRTSFCVSLSMVSSKENLVSFFDQKEFKLRILEEQSPRVGNFRFQSRR